MASPDFDRPMSAEQANSLLQKISTELKRRNQWTYNRSIPINKRFDSNLNIIQTVEKNYKPQNSTIDPENTTHIGNPKVILDIHGMAIVNSILKVNSINTQRGKTSNASMIYTKRLIGGDIKPSS